MHSRHAVCCDYVRVVPKYFKAASECKCSRKQNIYLKKKNQKHQYAEIRKLPMHNFSMQPMLKWDT